MEGVRLFFKRYTLSICFATVSSGAIYADWNATRKYKLRKAAEKQRKDIREII